MIKLRRYDVTTLSDTFPPQNIRIYPSAISTRMRTVAGGTTLAFISPGRYLRRVKRRKKW